MSGRRSNRTKHRTPCAVTIDGRRHNGFLVDYSMSGMFIQTSARPNVGERLDIELILRGHKLPMHVEVARRKTVPAQLRAVAGGGIGVRILSVPESFYRLIAAEEKIRRREEASGGRVPKAQKAPTQQPAPTPPPTASPQPTRSRYRVRVRATQGNRSRTLELDGGTEHEVARLALEELGEGWKVLEVTPLSGG
jgi:hypothetical protein